MQSAVDSVHCTELGGEVGVVEEDARGDDVGMELLALLERFEVGDGSEERAALERG